jgi:Tol biopolymer transport system component
MFTRGGGALQRWGAVLAVVSVACLCSLVPPGAGAAGAAVTPVDPYATANFTVTTDTATFGQAPVFMPDGQVVYGKDFGKGAGTQVYISNQDGSGLKCLTCELPSPNNVPAVRPQGDWILFHSWMGHRITLGSPGYGGLGSALWIMRPDGSHVTQLTELQKGFGADEGFDDYHAYWSPNGNQVVWAHLDWNFVNGQGQGKWDVEVANFVVSPSGVPSLTDVRVVRPANGSWYETQWWAPDGSGFLYTQTSGTAMDTELFFCRLTAAGCEVTQLTDNASWNEQAVFTPDGKDVIFMSSRDHPGFFNSFVQLAQDAGLTTDDDYLLTLEIFEAAYEQPVAQEATDLYELDLATGSVRRLTTDGNDGWIIPEFAWDPTHSFLIWTEARFPPGMRVPLPLNPITQLEQTAQFLEHPPLSSVHVTTSNLLQPSLPLQYRTRILRFNLGGS